jgi:hypothetical protein
LDDAALKYLTVKIEDNKLRPAATEPTKEPEHGGVQ